MSRNSSGTYTLPTGNPVVSGTVIEANWANSTLDDISAALTDSLSRSGKGSMSASLRIIDGSVSVPGWAFANETGSGAYRSAAGDWYLTVLGNNIARFRASGVDVTGNLGITGDTVTLESSTAYYPQIINRNKTNDANGSYFAFNKTRNGAIVQNGDVLGNLIFSGYDGASYLQGAYINALVTAAPSTNDMPTDLAFGTTPDGSAGPSERMRITKAGNVGIGTSSPAASTKLAVGGNTPTAGKTSVVGDAGGISLALSDNTNSSLYVKHSSPVTIGTDAGGALAFATNGFTERMRIDSSGNVGIGTSIPSYKLDVYGTSRFTDDVRMTINKALYLYELSGTNAAFIKADNSGNMLFSNGISGVSERMRITTTGNLVINTTSDSIGADGIGIKCKANPGNPIVFLNSSGALAGYIAVNGTATAYNTSSDYRLKENIQPMQNALGVVAQLNPVTYTWKADGSDGQGFIAHELQAVVPDCVTGEKDAVRTVDVLDDEGKKIGTKEEPVYQGIDTSFLVATLTKAIQELAAKVATLEAAAK